MAIMAKSTIMYITSDGSKFDTKEEAIRHEARAKLRKITPNGGALYQDDVIDFVLYKWDQIEAIMLGKDEE